MEKPDVDLIEGLSPAISIEQKTTGSNPRSTVGTVTEIYDYLRLLFANIGVPHCPRCGLEIASQSLERIVDLVLTFPQDARINVLAPVVRGRKGEFRKELEAFKARGFTRARIDGQFRALEDDIKLERRRNHTIDVVVDRLIVRSGVERRLTESVETALTLAEPDCRHQHARRRRPSVLTAPGLRGLRLERAGDDAARLLVQLAARRVPCLPGAGGDVGFRSGADRAGYVAHAPRRRASRRGARAISALVRDALETLGATFGIALDVPFAKLPKKQRDLLVFGPGAAPAAVDAAPKRRMRARAGQPYGRDFEGLLPNLRRRYEEGTWTVQEELERYRSLRTCPDCQGARLKPESLAVRVKGRTIAGLRQPAGLPGARRLHQDRADAIASGSSPSAFFARCRIGCASSTRSAWGT